MKIGSKSTLICRNVLALDFTNSLFFVALEMFIQNYKDLVSGIVKNSYRVFFVRVCNLLDRCKHQSYFCQHYFIGISVKWFYHEIFYNNFQGILRDCRRGMPDSQPDILNLHLSKRYSYCLYLKIDNFRLRFLWKSFLQISAAETRKEIVRI